MLLSVSMFAENNNVQIDFSKISPNSHPRLMMNENSFDKIREKLAVSANMSALHDGLVKELEKEMKSGKVLKYEFDVSGKRLLSVSRRALYRISHAAYAYKVTFDKRYLSYVEDQLDAVCAFPNWNESHYLDVAEMALGVSVAYDWLYDELAPEVKAKAEKPLTESTTITSIR